MSQSSLIMPKYRQQSY